MQPSSLSYFLLVPTFFIGFSHAPVQGVPVPLPQLSPRDFFAKYMFLFDPTDSSQRSLIKRQHIIVDYKVSSVNPNSHEFLNYNVRGGSSNYPYIPPKNTRQIRIFDLSNLTGENKTEAVRNYTKIIQEKDPIYQDKKKIQELELSLLDKGIWAVCQYKFSLPYPLDHDQQCTESELAFLNQR